MNRIFGGVIVSYSLFLTILLTCVKSFLSSQGAPGLLPFLSFRDLNYLDHLTTREPDPSRRKRLKWLRFSVYAAFGFFPVLLWILDLVLP